MVERCCCHAAHSAHRLTDGILLETISKSLTSLRSRSLSCDPRPDRSTSGTSCLSPICSNTPQALCSHVSTCKWLQGLGTHNTCTLQSANTAVSNKTLPLANNRSAKKRWRVESTKDMGQVGQVCNVPCHWLFQVERGGGAGGRAGMYCTSSLAMLVRKSCTRSVLMSCKALGVSKGASLLSSGLFSRCPS